MIKMMEAAWTYETLVPYHNTDDLDLNLHRREELKKLASQNTLRGSRKLHMHSMKNQCILREVVCREQFPGPELWGLFSLTAL
jgi:hypothetical protein